MLIKKLPYSLKTDYEGYRFVAKLYHSLLAQSSPEITIDFSECETVDGNLAAALGAVLDELVSNGFRLYLRRPESKQVRRVLSRNHFLQAWEVPTKTEDRENYMDYKKFRHDDSAAFKQYIDTGLIHKQRFPQHTTAVAAHIIENIYEIYANAIMHGQTEFVYSCGEYKETARVLEMTIVDCGLTIPANVNNYLGNNGQPLLGDSKAIEWALGEGNTTKRDTGGLGLAILRDFIEMNNGAIQIVSGSGMIEIFGNKRVERFLLDSGFPGTIVNMKFNFDDKKEYYMVWEKYNINVKDLL